MENGTRRFAAFRGTLQASSQKSLCHVLANDWEYCGGGRSVARGLRPGISQAGNLSRGERFQHVATPPDSQPCADVLSQKLQEKRATDRRRGTAGANSQRSKRSNELPDT